MTPEEQTAVELLKRLGYSVSKPSRGERVGEFIKRVGICHMSFYRRLASKDCPDVKMKLTPTKRISALYPNDAFDAFMRRGI